MAITEKYLNLELTTGLNDGTSEANAWQSFGDVVWAAGERVNIKNPSSRYDITSGLTITTAGTDAAGPVWLRGYGTTIGDGIKCQINFNTTSRLYWNAHGGVIEDMDLEGTGVSSVFATGAALTIHLLNSRIVNTIDAKDNQYSAVSLADVNAVGCYFESGGEDYVARLAAGSISDSVIVARGDNNGLFINQAFDSANVVNNVIKTRTNPKSLIAHAGYGIYMTGGVNAATTRIDSNTVDGFNTALLTEDLPLSTGNLRMEITNNIFMNGHRGIVIEEVNNLKAINTLNNAFYNISEYDANGIAVNSQSSMSSSTAVGSTSAKGIISIAVDKGVDAEMYAMSVGFDDPGIQLLENGQVFCYLKDSGGTGFPITAPVGSVTSTTGLQVITVAWDSAINTVHMYIGNKLVASDTSSLTFDPRTSGDVYIARDFNNTDKFVGVLSNAYFATNHDWDLTSRIEPADLITIVNPDGSPATLDAAPSARIKYSGNAAAWNSGTNEGTDNNATVTGTFVDMTLTDRYRRSYYDLTPTNDINLTAYPFKGGHVKDLFDRASGALAGTTTTDGEYTWTDNSTEAATFEIDSQGRIFSNGINQGGQCGITQELPGDVQISAMLYGNATTELSVGALYLKQDVINSSSQNYYAFDVETNLNLIRIRKYTDSTPSVLSSTSVTLDASSFPLNLYFEYIDGELTGIATLANGTSYTLTASDSDYGHNLHAGVQSYINSASYIYYDNFEIKYGDPIDRYQANNIAGGGALLRQANAFGSTFAENYEDVGGNQNGNDETIALTPTPLRIPSVNYVTFDGTNDHLTSTGLTNAVDGTQMILYANITPDLSFTGARTIWRIEDSVSTGSSFIIQNGTAINIYLQDNTGTVIHSGGVASAFTYGVEQNLLVAIDTITDSLIIYVDETEIYNGAKSGTGTNMFFTGDEVSVMGNFVGAGSYYFGDVGSYYFKANDWVDISLAENRRLFYTDTKKPSTLEAAPSVPDIQFTGNATAWNAGTNEGDGGAFVMSGAVEDYDPFEITIVAAASEVIEVDLASLTLTGNDHTINARERIVVEPLPALVLTGQDATILNDEAILIDLASLTLTGNDHIIAEGTFIPIDLATLTLTGQESTIIGPTYVNMDDTSQLLLSKPGFDGTGWDPDDIGFDGEIEHDIIGSLERNQSGFTRLGLYGGPRGLLNNPEVIEIDTASLVLTSNDHNINETITMDTSVLVLTALELEVDVSIPVDLATLTLTGNDHTINEEEIVFVDTASLVLTSNDHNIIENIEVDTASLILTALELDVDVSIPIDTATLILTGNEHNINETVDIDTANLILTGNDHTINEEEIVDVDTATLTLTALDTLINVNIPVDVATLTLTALELEVDQDIPVDLATLTLTGNDHNVIQNVDIDTSALIITGNDHTIIDTIPVDTSVLTLTGNDHTIADVTPVDVATLTLTGNDHNVIQNVDVDLASLVLTGNDHEINQEEIVEIDLAVLILTGNNHIINAVDIVDVDTSVLTLTSNEHNINDTTPIDTGSLILIGLEPNIIQSVEVDTASLVLTGNDHSINAVEIIEIDTANLTLVGNDHIINEIEIIDVDTSVLTLTGNEHNINDTVLVDTSSLTLTALELEIDEYIAIDTATLILTGNDHSINAAGVISVDLAELTLTGNDHVINQEEIIELDKGPVPLALESLEHAIVDVTPVDTASLVLTGNDHNIIQNILVDTASLILTQLDIEINAQEIIDIDLASLALTGNDHIINARDIIEIDTANLILTSNDHAINEKEVVNVDAASLTLVGFEPNIIQNIDIDTSTLILTGNDHAINAGGTVSIDLATLIITSNDHVINQEEIIELDKGPVPLALESLEHAIVDVTPVDLAALTLTGNEPNVIEFVDVDTASLVLTGNDVNIIENIEINTASLILTPFDVEISTDIVVETATLTLTPFDIVIDIDIPVDTANLSLIGNDHEINQEEIVFVDTASLILTGNDHEINQEEIVFVDTSVLTLTGNDHLIVQDEIVPVDTANLVLTGNDHTINEEEIVNVDTANLVLTGNDHTLIDTVPVDTSILILTGNDHTINTRDIIEVDTASIVLTGNDHAIISEEVVFVDLANLTLTGNDHTINEEEIVDVDTASLVLTGNDHEINQEIIIPIDTATLNLTGNDHIIDEGILVPVDPAALALTPLEVNVKTTIMMNVGTLDLTPFNPGLNQIAGTGGIILDNSVNNVKTSNIQDVIDGLNRGIVNPGITVRQPIMTSTDIKHECLTREETFSYPILGLLESGVTDMTIVIEELDSSMHQDWSLQMWISNYPGLKNAKRTRATTRDPETRIKVYDPAAFDPNLKLDFIPTYEIVKSLDTNEDWYLNIQNTKGKKVCYDLHIDLNDYTLAKLIQLTSKQ